MLKKSIQLIAIGLVTAFAVAATGTVHAQEKKAAAAADAKIAKPKAGPFSGKINEIDKAAKTINIGKEKKRTIYITAQTKIKKNGKDATLDDAAVGEEVGGYQRENAEGKQEAVSLRIGAKPEGTAKPKSPKKKKE